MNAVTEYDVVSMESADYDDFYEVVLATFGTEKEAEIFREELTEKLADGAPRRSQVWLKVVPHQRILDATPDDYLVAHELEIDGTISEEEHGMSVEIDHQDAQARVLHRDAALALAMREHQGWAITYWHKGEEWTFTEMESITPYFLDYSEASAGYVGFDRAGLFVLDPFQVEEVLDELKNRLIVLGQEISPIKAPSARE